MSEVHLSVEEGSQAYLTQLLKKLLVICIYRIIANNLLDADLDQALFQDVLRACNN